MNAPELMQPGVQTIRVARIARPLDNPRKHFDETAQAELVESVRRHGIIQPILVRPLPDTREAFEREHYLYELVAGERRLRAADAAQLVEIPALVRALTDTEVLEIQMIENLQRADLHPLEEAEGYEALHERHGYSVADIAAKVDKSEGYVYARLRLTSLCETARKAFFGGKLTPSTALLVARIPGADLQAKATQEIVRSFSGEPMSTAQASEHIQRTYMLRLATAPFKPSDADLLPGVGPCTTCPKRTGNAGELFDDIKGPDTCTDPKCFERKAAAHKDRVIEEAQAKGQKVIDGDAAKKIFAYRHSEPKGYVDLDQTEHRSGLGGKKRRTLVGKADVERVLLVNPHTNRVVEAVAEKAYSQVLADKGITAPATMSDAERQERQRVAAEKAYRKALFGALRLRVPSEPSLEDRRMIARAFYEHLGHDQRSRVRDIWSWSTIAADGSPIDARDAAQLALLMYDMALASELMVWTYSKTDPKRMLELAARLGVDAAEIKRGLKAEEKAKKKAKATKAAAPKKPAAKKPAAKKPAAKKFSPKKVPPKSTEPAAEADSTWPFPTSPQ